MLADLRHANHDDEIEQGQDENAHQPCGRFARMIAIDSLRVTSLLAA